MIERLMRIVVGEFGHTTDDLRIRTTQEALHVLPEGWRLLDAGAGELRYKSDCGHLQYVAQDFGQYDGEGNGTGLQHGSWDSSKLDIVCDITDIPEPDASFDAILCTSVFEHLPDPLSAFKEFARLLRPGGRLIFNAPFSSLTHFAPYHFCSGFNRYFYELHLPHLGFEILELKPLGNYFEFLAVEVRRLWHVSKRYAGKRPRFYELAAMFIVVKALRRFSRYDSGSSELACLHYHLVAEKKK